ncbi:MAG: sialate O-acetylesterase [Planctomycetota bacterium]
MESISDRITLFRRWRPRGCERSARLGRLAAAALCHAVSGCAIVPSAGDVQPIDVFLVAGQSNAVGFDAPASELTPADIDQSSILWWRVGDPPPDSFDSTSAPEGWQPLQIQPRGEPEPKGKRPRQYGNFRDASGGFGPEIGFAQEIGRITGARCAFIKVAFSGTSLARDWDPARVNEEESCYRALLDESRRALDALRLGDRRAGLCGTGVVEIRLRALLWVQGESDANEEDAARYEARLEALIRALRQDLSAPDLAAVVTVNDQFGGTGRPPVMRVVEAQRAVAARDSSVVFTHASAASRANGAHFDAQGTLWLGRQMALDWFGLEKSEAFP